MNAASTCRLSVALLRLVFAAGGVRRSVGFHDRDSFGRALMQRFGVTPNHYRSRFLAPRKLNLIYSQKSLN